jgi:multidrug resistance efflux pump
MELVLEEDFVAPPPEVAPPAAPVRPDAPPKITRGIGWQGLGFLIRLVFRIVRVLTGLLLIALSLLAMLPPTLFPVSSRGIVNARVALIRSPIPGEVTGVAADVGSIIKPRELLCSIKNDRVVQTQEVEQIRTELAKLKTEERSVRTEFEAKSAKLKHHSAVLKGFLERVQRRVELQLEDAKKLLRSKKEIAQLAKNELERHRRLQDDEILQRSTWAELQKTDALAQEALLVEESNVAQLANKLSNIRNGFMIDIESEYTRYLQLVTTLQVDVDEKGIKLKQLAGYQEDLSERLEKAKELVEKLSQQTVRSTTGCRILKREATEGQFVAEGGELFRFANASSLHVEAIFDNRYNGAVSVGDRAIIYLLGDRREIPAKVMAVHVADRVQRFEQFAHVLDPLPEEFTILFQLEPADVNMHLLGQFVRVLIIPKNANPLYQAAAWLNLNL